MKPSEALQIIESLSPAELKNELINILEWQYRKDKSLVNMAWYIRRIKYSREPRDAEKNAQDLCKKLGVVFK